MDSNNNSANMKLSPGMMCLVIGYRNFSKHLGKTVTLGKFIGKGELYEGYRAAKDLWEILGEGLVRGIYHSDGTLYTTVSSGVSFSQPKHLMPIRPEEDPLEITDVITKKEKA